MSASLRFLIVAGAIVLTSAFVSFAYIQEVQPDAVADDQRRFERLAGLYEVLDNNYFDTLDPELAFSGAMNGMLNRLDPHSSYFDPRLTSLYNEQYQGGYQGIGVSFRMLDDKITIMEVFDDGPSDRIGLKMGDQIIEIEGESAIGLTSNDVQDLLRGPDGTEVSVKVEREGLGRPLAVTITRGEIPIRSVENKFMLDERTGYVRIIRFASPTHHELERALQELTELGMSQLVLDIRGNGGGLLRTAYFITDKFLSGDRMVVYTDGRRADSKQHLHARPDTKYWDIPLVVLVDHASASASEILAGAFQDWDRAVIAGQTTFGKGLVQNVFRLSDGSRLDLTTAQYYTPSGRLIQRPYKDRDVGEYHLEAFEELDTQELPDELDEVERPEYQTATGRLVFGGGGITPDVELEQQQMFDTFVHALNFDLNVFLYARSYYWQDPERFTDLESFTAEFTPGDQMLAELLALAQERGFEYYPRRGQALSEEQIRTRFWELSDQIRTYLKAEIAQFYFGRAARFQFLVTTLDTWLPQATEHFERATEMARQQSAIDPEYFANDAKREDTND